MSVNATIIKTRSRQTARGPRRWLVLGTKGILAVLILGAVVSHSWQLTADWRRHATSDFIFHPNPVWLLAAAGLFIAGSFMFALYWRRLLLDCGLKISRHDALRAYTVGTLGKYLPGKVWTIVFRSGLLPFTGSSRLRAALAATYETLATMAVGAALAAIALLATEPTRWAYWSGAASLAVALAATLHPMVYSRVARLMSWAGGDTLIDTRFVPAGGSVWRRVPLILAGWLLLGASFAAVMHALGANEFSANSLVRSIGTAALANAAGFAVLIMPAGIGIREFIIIELLTPSINAPTAVAVSLLLRLVWTLAEACAAVALYCLPSRSVCTGPAYGQTWEQSASLAPAEQPL